MLADQGLGGGIELLVGFTAQVRPGGALITAGLPLVGGGLNGAIDIDQIVQRCGEGAALFCNAGDGQGACGGDIDIGNGLRC